MHTEAIERTLLEDWQARRQDLLSGTPGSNELAGIQVRILDYLIRRYADSEEAARSVRGTPNREFYLDGRAIVVHHHVWRDRVSGVKSGAAAKSRAASILRRMTSGDIDDSDRTEFEPPFDPTGLAEENHVPRRWRRSINRAVYYYGDPKPLIEALLEETPYLPTRAVWYLYRRASDPGIADLQAAQLLLRCRNQRSGRLAARAWIARFEAGLDDEVQEELATYLRQAGRHERPIDEARLELADDDPHIRMRATEILAHVGNLEDVGMLSDLLAMPPQEDEAPEERSALAEAMEEIARR